MTPEEHRNRVVQEVLGGVDYFEKAVGPNGPWAYRSLTLTRTDNRIFVKDADGRLCKMYPIPVTNRDGVDLHQRLRDELDDLNEETLNEL